MTHTLHHITTAQFANAIMRYAKHYRRMKQRRLLTLTDVASITGHNHMYIGWWQTGRRRQATLQEALCVLQAVREWAA